MGNLELYDLEAYLFDTVNPHFHREGSIGTFDLMLFGKFGDSVREAVPRQHGAG